MHAGKNKDDCRVSCGPCHEADVLVVKPSPNLETGRKRIFVLAWRKVNKQGAGVEGRVKGYLQKAVSKDGLW